MGDNVPFRSVQLGVLGLSPASPATLSWSGAGQPQPNETSPAAAVRRLFPTTPPDVGAPADPPTSANFLDTLRAQLKVTEAAFTRDVTRIATVQICKGTCGVTLPGTAPNPPSPFDPTGSRKEYHLLAHDAQYHDGLTLAQLMFMKEIAASVDRMAATPTADSRTLLDHTLIVVMTDAGDPNAHTTTNLFTLLIGDLHGTVKPSVCAFEDRGHVDLLRTIAKLFGESPDAIGPASKGAGLLTSILAP